MLISAVLKANRHFVQSSVAGVFRADDLVEKALEYNVRIGTGHVIDFHIESKHEGSVAWISDIGGESGKGRLEEVVGLLAGCNDPVVSHLYDSEHKNYAD